MGFQDDLQELINKYSKENESNTPDFILAEYLVDCLNTFDKVSKAREHWYGRGPAVSQEELVAMAEDGYKVRLAAEKELMEGGGLTRQVEVQSFTGDALVERNRQSKFHRRVTIENATPMPTVKELEKMYSDRQNPKTDAILDIINSSSYGSTRVTPVDATTSDDEMRSSGFAMSEDD